MIKIALIIVSIILAFEDSATSTFIDCKYSSITAIGFADGYYCLVNINPNINTLESAKIDSVSGTHKYLKSNYDVVNFWAERVTMKYFPKDLNKFFYSLKCIIIFYCQLEEIHQEDLRPFANLLFLRLQFNAIEIIEKDLFKYNPHLEFIELNEPRISHIDGNAFDHLGQLKYFWMFQVSCIKQKIDDSRYVLEAIKLVKAQCTSLEFSEIEVKIRNLENESKSLSFEAFKANLDNFEKMFNNSNFLKFRPLNERLASLKLVDSNGSGGGISKNFDKLPDNNLKNLSSKSEDPIVSQCAAGDIFNVIKNLENSVNNIQVSQSQVGDATVHTKVDELIALHNSSYNQIASKISDIQGIQAKILSENEVLKSSMTDSFSNLTAKFNDHKFKAEFTQDELLGRISDMEASISNVKSSQNEVKSSFTKFRTSQNEMKIALDDLKAGNSEDKLMSFGEKMLNLERKMEGIEEHLMNFEVRNADKIDKELANTRHKIALNFDEKIKGIEKRLMSRFEEVLEEKLERIFKEKLGKLLDARSGTV